MPDSEPSQQTVATERQFISNEYRRRRICKPTDFSTFKSPALGASIEVPIVLAMQTLHFNGKLIRLYLDGYDAELAFPSRRAGHAQKMEASAVDLIGSHARLTYGISSVDSSLPTEPARVQVTITRRVNENVVIVRMKDLDLPPECYAARLALLLSTDRPPRP